MKDSSAEHKTVGSNQQVHKIGLYYVCYELSKRGWDTRLNSQNAVGIDAVIRGRNGKEFTIQVKSISTTDNAAIFPTTLDNIIADFIFIVNNVSNSPNIFIVNNATVKSNSILKKENDGIYYFEPEKFKKFKDNWDIIGDGGNK